MFGGLSATLGATVRSGVGLKQFVSDPGFASAGSWTLGGAGIGTSAVAAGVLQVTSTSNAYTVSPALTQTPLPAGKYTLVYTVLNYVSGTIGSAYSNTPAVTLTGGVAGAARTANGTYTETITLLIPGIIGLAGQGAAIVNSLQVDNLTITRVS
jgi:hypothetical protein